MPDASTFNTLLKACMRGRDVRRAELALSWMREDGVPPDSVTYNTLIKVIVSGAGGAGVRWAGGLHLWEHTWGQAQGCCCC